MNRLGTFASNDPKQAGQAAVEFAMTFAIFVLGFFGIVGLAIVFFAWLTSVNGAREGARYIIARPTATDSEVTAQICRTTIGLGMSEANCNSNVSNGTLSVLIEPGVSWCLPGTQMSVKVDYRVPVPTLRASFFNGGGITFLGPVTVTSTAVMRIE